MTIRSVSIGVLLALFIGLVSEYSANRLGYEPAATHLPAALLLPYITFIFLPNLFALRFLPHLALRPTELITLFAMGLAASLVPDQAMTKYLMVVMSAPHYFVSPENQWRELFFSYLPDWLVVASPVATRGFYEGIPPGMPIPWGAWISPLFWWGTLIAALMAAGVGLSVILRKQWMEHERLRFPLGEVSLHLLGVPPVSGGPAFIHTRLFAVGFCLMVLLMTWNISTFWTLWPHFPFMAQDFTSLSFGPAFPPLPIRMNALIFLLAFFVNRDVLFSIWFFILFNSIEQGALASIGVTSTSDTIVAGGLVGIQSIAGLVTFVLFGLWMARRHLKEVWLCAVGRPSGLSDANELISYRSALVLLALGFLYLVCWLHAAGMSLPLMSIFLFLLLVIYLSMARVVAEAGLVAVDLPINPHQFTIAMVGSSTISHVDLTVFGLANGFSRNWRTFTMIGPSHIAWFGQAMGRFAGQKHHPAGEGTPDKPLRAGSFFAWTAVAFWVSAIASIGYVIWAGYTYGAQNLRTDLGTGRGVQFYSLIPTWINNATQIGGLEVVFFAAGGALMLMLTLARYYLVWWPLHPIGMVVSVSSPVVSGLLPVFLAWLIQTALMRFGGGSLYKKAQPFFIGALVGYLFGQVVGLVVDLIWFPGASHPWEVY